MSGIKQAVFAIVASSALLGWSTHGLNGACIGVSVSVLVVAFGYLAARLP